VHAPGPAKSTIARYFEVDDRLWDRETRITMGAVNHVRRQSNRQAVKQFWLDADTDWHSTSNDERSFCNIGCSLVVETRMSLS
jgi:hypothetical protein